MNCNPYKFVFGVTEKRLAPFGSKFSTEAFSESGTKSKGKIEVTPSNIGTRELLEE